MIIPVAFLVVVASVCAIKAMRAVHLLHSSLWLAGVSVAVTIMLYVVGAYPMAVIELSLSVGLITILLVFAISMVGADSPDVPVSKWFNWPLLIVMLLLVIGLTIPLLTPQAERAQTAFTVTFWQQREADVIAQIALIFAGVLGVLGLLTEIHNRKSAQKQTHQPQGQEDQPPIGVPEEEPELERV
jgi:NADH:ubiquinone oxidoreductase subunit 6 (subunit J)